MEVEHSKNVDVDCITHEEPVDDMGDCDTIDSKAWKSIRHKLGIGKSASSTKDKSLFASSLLIHEYKMDRARRGKCLIFGHTKMPEYLQMEDRVGTKIDCQNLRRVFENLRFEVEVHEDLTVQKIDKVLEKVSREDHSDADCFVCCLLTCGDKGVYYASDNAYSPEILWKHFLGDKCEKLIGKPKLFFIEAYQGVKVDMGTFAVADGPIKYNLTRNIPRIPTYADFLFAHSTVSGFYSWINKEKGSWFVQSLCECLQKYQSDQDILDILSAVNNKVAYSFESKTGDSSDSGYKQMPVYTSMLTKKLYMNPKNV